MNRELQNIVVSILFFLLAFCFHKIFILSLIFYILAYLVVGYDVYRDFFHNITKHAIFDEKFLMILSTIGALIIGEFPEAVFVMLFYQIGEYLGDQGIDRSKEKVMSLLDQRSEVAHVLEKEEMISIPLAKVQIGAHIIVKPGEIIPLDGEVLDQDGYVDNVMLTGESLPVSVHVGDMALSGGLVLNQQLCLEVKRSMKESTVSKILHLIEDTASRKTGTERFITKFARIYTPIVVLLGLIIGIVPPLFFDAPLATWVYRALIFLVASCPCALVLSIPLGFFCGIGRASQRGILIKGSDTIEKLLKVRTVVFDKTGTLTKGTFEVVDIEAAKGFRKSDLLKYAAHVEMYSNHPIATSIRERYGKKLVAKDLTSSKEKSGYGIEGVYCGKEIFIGNQRLMAKHHIPCPAVDRIGTVLYMAVDQQYAGYFVIADELRSDAKELIGKLERRNIESIVLSGDKESIVRDVAQKLAISSYRFELLPQDKVQFLQAMIEQVQTKNLVAFVGDGMNDSPALMAADVGISMGGIGSDAAIEASDMVIMNDQLSKIAEALDIAQYTKHIVLENVIFAIGMKVVVLLLGLFGLTAMWMAIFADVGVSVLAILNCFRIWYQRK